MATLAGSGERKAKIIILKLDVKSEASIQSAAEEVKRAIGEERLDFLINNAAAATGTPTALMITPEAFTEDMKGNVLGPALIAKAFLPLLERVSRTGSRPPIVTNISSSLGSIGLEKGAKEAIYSISKAALNMLTYKQSAEKPNIIWISLDPGWVKTDMGGPNAQVSVDESVRGILQVLRNATIKDSGTYKHFTGKDLPW